MEHGGHCCRRRTRHGQDPHTSTPYPASARRRRGPSINTRADLLQQGRRGNARAAVANECRTPQSRCGSAPFTPSAWSWSPNGQPHRSDRPACALLDDSGSLALLEENLVRLPLRHYQNLYEPAFELRYILEAISRCKDELISRRADYRAEALRRSRRRPSRRRARERRKGGRGRGGLRGLRRLALPGRRRRFRRPSPACDPVCSRNNPDVLQEVQGRLPAHAVDEYQDVNFASACFLRALCKAGSDVWVVADQRQSIYRFRGAEPSNVTRFPAEFGGDSAHVEVNYRSGSAGRAAPSNASPAPWTPVRARRRAWKAQPSDSRRRHTITAAPTLATEAAAIRDDRGVGAQAFRIATRQFSRAASDPGPRHRQTRTARRTAALSRRPLRAR